MSETERAETGLKPIGDMMKKHLINAIMLLPTLVTFLGAAAPKTEYGFHETANKSALVKIEKTFQIPMGPGTYLFLGMEDGTKDKHPADVGTIPLVEVHIREDANLEKCVLEVGIGSETNAGGARYWNVHTVLRATSRDGVGFVLSEHLWSDVPQKQSAIADCTIEMADMSKDVAVADFQLLDFNYAKVDGESHRLVVAASKDSQAFVKAVNIPKTFFMFDWKNWIEIPIGAVPTTKKGLAPPTASTTQVVPKQSPTDTQPKNSN